MYKGHIRSSLWAICSVTHRLSSKWDVTDCMFPCGKWKLLIERANLICPAKHWEGCVLNGNCQRSPRRYQTQIPKTWVATFILLTYFYSHRLHKADYFPITVVQTSSFYGTSIKTLKRICTKCLLDAYMTASVWRMLSHRWYHCHILHVYFEKTWGHFFF